MKSSVILSIGDIYFFTVCGWSTGFWTLLRNSLQGSPCLKHSHRLKTNSNQSLWKKNFHQKLPMLAQQQHFYSPIQQRSRFKILAYIFSFKTRMFLQKNIWIQRQKRIRNRLQNDFSFFNPIFLFWNYLHCIVLINNITNIESQNSSN